MNIKRYITKERLIFAALLLFVTAVVIYAPLRYGFIYPTAGDDTAHHMRFLNNLTADFGYIGKLGYYGLVVLLPFTLLGLNPGAVFSVFNYAVLVGVFVSMWLLVRRFYGVLPAVFSFYVSVFVVLGIWKYFNDGTIFNIFNLWVIAPLAYYALCSWLENGKPKWLLATGALFVATSLVHSSSYLFILASVALFLAVYAIWQYRRKDRVMFKRVFLSGAVFSISALTAWLTWAGNQVPKLTSAMVGTITGEQTSHAEVITFDIWFNQHVNPGAAFLLLIAVFMLLVIFKKGRQEEKEEIVSRLNQPLTWLFLCFIFVLTIGTFTKLGYDYGRFARDQVTFIGLGIAILLGLGLKYYRLEYKKAWIAIIAIVLIVYPVPIHNFLRDHTALRPCDEQAIEYFNQLSSEPVTVQHFVKTAPWIYELYTNENIEYKRAYNLDEYNNADYLLYRNTYMTYYTRHLSKPDDFDITENDFSAYEDLTEIAHFTSDDDEIIIYKVEAP